MERIFQYTITQSDNEKPIDLHLRSMGYSSQNLIALKKMPESILLNGVWVYMNQKLHTDDILTVHIKESISSPNIVPASLPLEIIYEDEDILVVNKPSNMPIHPSQNNYDNTLANAVMNYYHQQDIPYVFRCVNRLDRDTSGLTILGKHLISGNILSTMVQNREIKREYLAIVSGIPTPASDIIDAPIARVEGSTIERCVDMQCGEHAVTHYEVQRSFQLPNRETLPPNPQVYDSCVEIKPTAIETFSLVSLWLETGRTHQIRVHMKHIGHPLLGDFLYHPDMRYISRQALHSYRLTFSHPITKEQMTFTAPLPNDMNLLLA